MMLNDRFEIEKEIGRGGIGVVYRAADTHNNRKPVVIKVLLKQSDEKARNWTEQHFHKEARALARINHPGVVKLIDSGITEDGKPFFAMEFIEGCDLRSQIDPKRGLVGDFARAANIIRQLGEAIGAAHDKGVYHRDLKPENIMLEAPRSVDEEEQVKVIDFGIATVKDSYDEKTRTTQLFAGSTLYMAPEQLENRPTAASDVYALGVIAYEMLTGRTPFVPDLQNPIAGMMQLMQMQREGARVRPTDLRPSLPVEADRVILKALALHARDRYSRAEDFGNELAEALMDAAEPTTPELLERLSRRVQAPGEAVVEAEQKPKAQTWLIVAITLLLAAAAGFIAWPRINRSAVDQARPVEPLNQEHTLSYWGELQKYRGNKPIGKPTRLTGGIAGETYFNAGDGLRFFIASSDNGYLYLINEEAGTATLSPGYRILFPSPEANNSSSKVSANEQVATSENVFDERAGTEKVWIVWSANPIAELEKAVQQWANSQNEGVIKDPKQAAFLSNFIGKYGSAKLLVEPDEANEQMKLRGRGDVLVYSLKLKHR